MILKFKMLDLVVDSKFALLLYSASMLFFTPTFIAVSYIFA